MLADLHSHTHFSFDGAPDATVDSMAEAAIAKGLTHLAITDHCDINGEIEGLYPVLDKEAVFAAVTKGKEKYRGRLEILFGVELGQATQYPKEAGALLARYPYDIVLGSLHNLAGERDFYYMDFKRIGEEERNAFFRRVIKETAELCDFPGIQVLTHITYMERYIRKFGGTFDYTPFRDELASLFEKVIKKGLCLELNTSTLRYGFTMPREPLIRLYRECGGTHVTLGGDAHTPDAVAQHFDEGKRILRSAGFTHLSLPTKEGILTYPI